MKMLRLVAAGSLALIANLCVAQQAGGAGAALCRADVQKFCQGIAPGGGRIRECLASHADALTPACQQAVKQDAAKGASDPSAAIAACTPDAKSICSGVQPGGGRVLDCLVDHQNDISQVCYEALKKRQDAEDASKGKTQ
jgi:hypothetical protein